MRQSSPRNQMPSLRPVAMPLARHDSYLAHSLGEHDMTFEGLKERNTGSEVQRGLSGFELRGRRFTVDRQNA